MISKDYILKMFILVSLFCCFSCSVSRIDNEPVIDIDGLVVMAKVGEDKVSYVRENGKRLKTCSKGVEFDGGRDSLLAYLNDKYVNHPSYNCQEYNTYEYFIILFDKNLVIEEVRILYRKGYGGKKFYYDSIYVDALKGTTGMWHKTIANKKWYYYLHRQRVY